MASRKANVRDLGGTGRIRDLLEAPLEATDIPDGLVANAKLADMAAGTVKARGTASTGVPEDIATGDGLTLDATSLRTKQQMSITADASGLKLSGDAATPGNTKYYGTDGSGNKGFNSFPSTGGLTLLSYAGAVGTGTTYTVTGLGGYKTFIVFLRDVSHNSGSAQSFRVELSGDGGSTWGSALNPTTGTTFVAASAVSGAFFISNVDQTNNQTATAGYLLSGSPTDTSSRGPIDALRFSFSGGNFDNGSIDIYGLK